MQIISVWVPININIYNKIQHPPEQIILDLFSCNLWTKLVNMYHISALSESALKTISTQRVITCDDSDNVQHLSCGKLKTQFLKFVPCLHFRGKKNSVYCCLWLKTHCHPVVESVVFCSLQWSKWIQQWKLSLNIPVELGPVLKRINLNVFP